MHWRNLSRADVLEIMEALKRWAHGHGLDLPLHTPSIALTVAVGSGRGPDASPRSLSHCCSQAEQTSLNGAVPTAPPISSTGRSGDNGLFSPCLMM